MIVEFFIAFCGGFLGGILGYYAFSWMTRRLLYNLSVDVADLQERHLRAVRKAASKERWENESELDEKIVGALQSTQQPKGWTKWPSSGRSENSSAAQQKP